MYGTYNWKNIFLCIFIMILVSLEQIQSGRKGGQSGKRFACVAPGYPTGCQVPTAGGEWYSVDFAKNATVGGVASYSWECQKIGSGLDTPLCNPNEKELILALKGGFCTRCRCIRDKDLLCPKAFCYKV